MDTRIARPRDSRHTAPRAHTSRLVASMQPQTGEKSASGNSTPKEAYTGAASIVTRPAATYNGSGIAGPSSSRLPIGTAAVRSRPGPASLPGESENRAAVSSVRNFSRPQAGAAAAPVASRPNMRGMAVGEVGFENWARRHESVAALPAPARGSEYVAAGIVRSYKSRVPSALREQGSTDSEQLSALPSAVSTPADSERQTPVVRWQGERACRTPVQVQAELIRSQAASLVAATESVHPSVAASRYASSARPSRSAPLPSSPLRPPPANAVETPATYFDMHETVQRAPTRLPPKIGPTDWGANYSPWCSGTTIEDVHRRAAMTRKFPVPVNAFVSAQRERVFAAPFVDAPVVCGRRGRAQLEKAVLAGERERIVGDEVVAALAPEAGDETAVKEKKKGWKRVSAFLSRKLGRKGKEAPSSSSPLPSPPSPQTPASPPSLVWASSSNGSPSPATPVQRHAEPEVVIARPLRHQTLRISTHPANQHQPVSPFRPSEKPRQHDPAPDFPLSEASKAQTSGIEQAAASDLALRREYDELMGHGSTSPASDREPSPLEEADAELFPSESMASERWANADAALHEAVAEAFAEEDAAADWAGEQEMAAQVDYVGKGKGKMVDLQPVRSRHRGRRELGRLRL